MQRTSSQRTVKLDGIVFVHDDPSMWTYGAGRVVVSLARSIPVLLVYPLGVRALVRGRNRLALSRALWREGIGSGLDRVGDASLMRVPMLPLASRFHLLSHANTAWLAARIRRAVARLPLQ